MIETVEKIVTVDWSECELVESVPEKLAVGLSSRARGFLLTQS
jgi:hypothetical protein